MRFATIAANKLYEDKQFVIIDPNKKEITVATATAGNHGRSVAWGAKRLGIKCKIFISENVSEERAEKMRKLKASLSKHMKEDF